MAENRPSEGRVPAERASGVRPAAHQVPGSHPADAEPARSHPTDAHVAGSHPTDPPPARPHPTAPDPTDPRPAVPHSTAPHSTAPHSTASHSTDPRGADSHPTATQAALWITHLLQQLPELAAELVPGRAAPAHRPAPPPPPADLAARLRQEREEALLLQQQHGLVAPGHSAAPLRLHISDAIRDISDGVVELEEAVRDRLGLPRPRRAPVPERLKRIAALLDGIAADPVLAAHVRDETRRMARRCARALGDTETVVRMSGRCPWCDSVSLRAFPDRGAVLCINPACRCPEPDCGCHDDPAYRHTWDEGEWKAAAR
ncbi:hypothetical protein [Streptomyces canus]|uniref:hypothetical protein n=1 Tax=Streptomyces canus TaxID=58343 RepID=UPI003CE9141C